MGPETCNACHIGPDHQPMPLQKGFNEWVIESNQIIRLAPKDVTIFGCQKRLSVAERFLRGAPFLSPLLFSNMGLMGLVILLPED